ncbi:MAG TPA: MBL fold metallo-hydrolase [Chitinophagaceae bacterium]|nr:MBL fold metallo-hydrolase [Chitinophagaceae bacterium]
MALFISSIASGSNGNCYYVGNATEAVLIDAGISCREIEARLQRLQLAIAKIKAVFISHEHSDHIQGLSVLARKYSLPVYITTATYHNGRLKLQGHPVHNFQDQVPVSIGNLTITPFSKAHDAADPHSFVVSCNGVNAGVFTDIGTPCSKLAHHFGECHAAFLEANYDEQLLAKGNYPAHLKARIRGGNGHLSNRQALEVFKKYKSPNLSHLLLAHLSKNNNCPKLVQNLFSTHAGNTEIIIASRYEASQVYKVTMRALPETRVAHYNTTVSQLSFSF